MLFTHGERLGGNSHHFRWRAAFSERLAGVWNGVPSVIITTVCVQSEMTFGGDIVVMEDETGRVAEPIPGS
jgi:hypothetical protein